MGMARQVWPALAALAIATTGCGVYFGDDDDDPDPTQNTCHPNNPTIDPGAVADHYIIDTIDIPSTSSEAVELGLDLDGDDQGRVDNAIGQILSVFSSQGGGYDLDAEQKALIDSGDILHLLEVRATSLTTALRVGVTLMHGLDTDGDPSDNLDGSESFAIDAAKGQGTMYGCVQTGQLDVRRGTVPIAITFPGLGEPFIVDAVAARIEATVNATSMSGKLAGAVTEQDVDQKVLPVLAEGLNRVIARDCTDCVCDGFGEIVVDLFDDDDDCQVSDEELRNDSLIGALFAPDLDLFDSAGNYAPNQDGVEDSLSIGVGFTAVGAAVQ